MQNLTREQAVQMIAEALLARHLGTTWERTEDAYHRQAEYLLEFADANDTRFAAPGRDRRARPNDRLEEAIRWLGAALQDGPRTVRSLIANAKTAANISRETLYRAFQSYPYRKVFREKGQYCWLIGVDPTEESTIEK